MRGILYEIVINKVNESVTYQEYIKYPVDYTYNKYFNYPKRNGLVSDTIEIKRSNYISTICLWLNRFYYVFQ